MFLRLFIARSGSVRSGVFLNCWQEFPRVSVVFSTQLINVNMANTPQ